MAASIWFPGYTPSPTVFGLVPNSAKELGCAGDGVTDDSVFLQAGLDSGKCVWLEAGKTYLAANLQNRSGTTTSGFVCFGGKATILVKPGVNTFGVKIVYSNFILDGVDIVGGNIGPYNTLVAPTPGSRNGLIIGNAFGTSTGITNISIQNSNIFGFDYSGITILELVVGYSFGKRLNLFNVNCSQNYVNYWFTPRAEYVVVSQCYGYEGYVGVLVQSGNNTFVACHFERNTENCQLTSGENNAHGQFLACSFNHAIQYGLHGLNVVYGESFVGCAFWFAPILLDTCIGVKITQGQIVNSDVTITGGGLNCIDDNWTQTPINKIFNGFTFTTFRRNRTSSTDITLDATYGDVLLECNSCSLAYPITFINTAITQLTLISSLQKYQGVTATFLINSGTFYVTRSGRYEIDARVLFNTLAAAEKPVLTITRYTGVTVVETHIDSREFTANQNNCTVAVNIRLNAANGDVIMMSLNTRTATGITIPTGGIMFRACSID